MVIICPQCQTQFALAENITTRSHFKVRCSRCKHIFVAQRTKPSADMAFVNLPKALSADDSRRVVAISNQKGGVAKTSTCLNLGTSLSLLKKKVLLVDFDAQANLTISLGYSPARSFYDVLKPGGHALADIIFETKYPGLLLLPSNKNMVLLNRTYFGRKNFEYLLKDRLLGLNMQFDYILIDTPPAIGFFTLNALTASNMVLIPSQCDFLSTHGVDQIINILKVVKLKTNPRIDYRILITMFDPQSTTSQMICKKLKAGYGDRTFDTIIAMDEKIKESQVMSMPVIHYDRQSISGKQYMQLAKEIIGSRYASKS